MIFIKVENSIVTFIHTRPEILNDAILADGLLVESIPEPEQLDGKTPVLKYDGTNLYYEYVDAPVDEMTALKNQLAAQNQKLADQEQAILELTTLLAGGTTNV